jgi:hypothetical protein
MRTELDPKTSGLAVYDEEEAMPPQLLEPFAAWLDGELQKLDERWSALAAPHARQAKFAASQAR